MKPSEIHPSRSTNPYARFFARLDDIHETVNNECVVCRQQIPCDTMRSLWIYSREIGALS